MIKPTFARSKSCKRQFRQRWQRSLNVVIVCTTKKIKKPSLAKHIRSTCSLAEQHNKLYVQSKREATATKQVGEQLQSRQGPQNMCVRWQQSSSVHS